jgi:hypothetical protein
VFSEFNNLSARDPLFCSFKDLMKKRRLVGSTSVDVERIASLFRPGWWRLPRVPLLAFGIARPDIRHDALSEEWAFSLLETPAHCKK